MNTENKHNLSKRIEEVLKHKTTALDNAYTKSLEELVEDLNIYQLELEFQNDELKRIQLELEQSKKGYFQLFENAPVGYVIIGEDMDLIDCNQTFKKMISKSSAQKECRNKMDFRKFITAADQDKFHLFFAQILKSKDSAETELALISPHNEALYVQITGRYAPTKTDSRTLLSIKDISEQKRSQDELRLQKNQFETLVNNIPGITYRANNDTDRTMLFLSKNVGIELGYSNDELLHNNKVSFGHLIHEADLKKVRRAISNGVENKEAFEVEYRIGHKNGTLRWIWEKGHGVYNEQGKLLYIDGFMQDITEIKNNEDQLAGFFSVNLDLLLITDLDATIIKVNKEWENLLGYKAEELEQKKFLELIHPDDIQSTIDVVSRLEEKSNVLNFINRYRCKDGSYRVLEWRAQPKENIVYAAARDITERKLAEEKLRDSEARLRQLNLAKDKFYSIIAHDLKNPFNTILGFSDLLLEQVRDNNYEGIDEYAEIVSKSSHRLMDLLTNLLEWSQTQTDGIRFNPKHYDLEDIIDECLKLFDDNAKQKSITIKKILPQNINVFADKSMISTVMRNLLSNAIKFSKEGGQIIISAQKTPYKTLISVKDNGIGIEPNRIKSLFSIDSGESTQGTNREQGTGLGLILCKEFVDKHGGKLSVESEAGKGSTFHFTLPLTKGADEQNEIVHDRKQLELNDESFSPLLPKTPDLITNVAPVLLYIYNIEKQQNVWTNEAHKQYFGNTFKSSRHLQTTDVEQFVHPDDFKQLSSLMNDFLPDKSKKQTSLELRFREKAHWKWMTLLVSKFKEDANGKTLEVLGALFDIDDRKKVEEKLLFENNNTAFLTNLAIKLTNSPAGISVGQVVIPEIKMHTGAVFAWYAHFDHEKQAFFFNHIDVDSKLLNTVLTVAGKDILKKPSKVSKENYHKIIKSNVDIFSSIHELTFGEIPAALSKAIATITGVRRYYAVVHVFGDKIYGGTILAFRQDQPEPSIEMLHSYAYLVAITLRRNFAEQELIMAKEAAEESNRLKSAFLASISHELKTPLNHVIGFSDLIKSEVSDPKIHNYASIIFNSGTNFLTMIEDILALALSEQTDIRLRMKSFKGMDLFQQNKNLLTEILSSAGKEDKIKLFFKPDAKVLSAMYVSDKLKINQVLTNLFRNAVKFTHEGSITFGIRQEKTDSLTFYVADTGIGITKEKIDIIFDFFRQADDSDTRLYDGLGIGLAISRRVANVMGGCLKVESTPGKGSVFYFSVPVRFAGAITDETNTSGLREIPDWRSRTILVAEDDDNSMMMITTMLKATKAKLLLAGNGEEAVNQIRRNNNISLVLMDVKMPVMDGIEATRLIKSRKPSLPVIALTAYTLSTEKDAIRKAGCDLIVNKPIDRSELFKEIGRFI
jgi:two-component system, sensor histidine kinase and response regulator